MTCVSGTVLLLLLLPPTFSHFNDICDNRFHPGEKVNKTLSLKKLREAQEG